jgi:hypothetical protein
VLELLFSATLVAVLYTLEPRKLITCRAWRSAIQELQKRRTVSVTLDSDVPILDLDGPPLETGGHSTYSSSTSSSPPIVHVYMSLSPLYKPSHLITTLYSVPVTPNAQQQCG